MDFREKGFFVSLILYSVALPVSMSLTNIALGLVVFFAAFMVHRDGLPGWLVPRSIYVLLAFFLWAAITVWIAQGTFLFSALTSFAKTWNFLPYLVIPLGFKLGHLRILKVLRILVSVASVVVILGAIQYWTGFHYFFEGWFGSDALIQHKRFYGFQSHPLHSGGLYTILSLMAISQTIFYRAHPAGMAIDRDDIISSSKEKAFWGVNAMVLAGGVLLTGSRSYYLALLMGTIILLSAKSWKHLLGGLMVGAVLLGAAVSLDSNIRNRLKTLYWKKTDDSAKMRTYMWKSALLMAKDHPITGIGYKRWKEEVPSYAAYFLHWNLDKASFAHAHNSYLTVLSETGIIGLGILIYFWVLVLKEILKALAKSNRQSVPYAFTIGSLASACSILAAGFFEHNVLTATISLSLFFAIGLSRAINRSVIFSRMPSRSS